MTGATRQDDSTPSNDETQPYDDSHLKQIISKATKFHRLGANVVGIPEGQKGPDYRWRHLLNNRQKAQDLVHVLSGKIRGLGFVNGPNGWRSFDIDHSVSSETLSKILETLGLPPDYEWVEESVSGNGRHVWIRVQGEDSLDGKSVRFGDLRDGSGGKLELRWSGNQTFAAGTEIGCEYRWINGEPDEAPTEVTLKTALAAFDAVATYSPKKSTSAESYQRTDKGRPGDYFNNGNYLPLLEQALREENWTPTGTREENGRTVYDWLRPGGAKDRSITINYYPNTVYCFTSNAPPMEMYAAYTAFEAITAIKYKSFDKGSFAAATKYVVEHGFEAPTNDDDDDMKPEEWKLITLSELRSRPKPEYVIDGILFEKTHNMMFGEPNAGKSSMGLYMACSVATGADFFGYEVQQGLAVFVAAEGIEALAPRAEGWEINHGTTIDPDMLMFLERSPQLTNKEHTKRVIDLINTQSEAIGQPARLVVIDTLSKTSMGLNQNDTKDMQPYMHAAFRIARKTGAAVVLIHHSNKSGNYSGSVNIMGEVYTAIQVEDGDGHQQKVEIQCKKMRMAEKFPSFYVKGTKMQLMSDETEDTIVYDLIPDNQFQRIQGDGLIDSHREILDTLGNYGSEGGLTRKEWWEECEHRLGISKSTFDRARRELYNRGKVVKNGMRYLRMDKLKEPISFPGGEPATEAPGIQGEESKPAA